MPRFVCLTLVVLLTLAGRSRACLRPQIDERAVQWSTAIMDAKLVSIGPKMPLGQVQERQGARGALGVSTTSYFYRTYEFEVIHPIVGSYKAGDRFPVLRLWMDVQNPPAICSQHLAKAAVGKEFVLLLRPLSQFNVIWPNSVHKPDVPGAMVPVHLEPKTANSTADADLGEAIVEARGDERQATPARISTEIAAVLSAPDDAKAQPAMKILTRMGPKVIPDLQQAAKKAPSGPGQFRLDQLVAELTPPDPVMKSNDEPDQGR